MIFVDDLGNPEGPVLLPDGSWVVLQMHPDRGCLTWISKDGTSRKDLCKTGRPNGATIDRNGVLWIAESMSPPSLLRATTDGEYDVVLEGCDGDPFLFPNDLCFGPDGWLYMTDSGVTILEWRELDSEERATKQVDGRVYKIDLSTMQCEKLDSGIPFTNGIAFGPDDYLYVAATQNGMVYRYEWSEFGLGPREEFANVRDPEKSGAFRGPDGMAFGQDGNLYVAVVGQGDVTVLNPGGEVVRRIQLEGPAPTNVAFGPPGSRKLYVTEQGVGHFEVHDVDTDGMPLYG